MSDNEIFAYYQWNRLLFADKSKLIDSLLNCQQIKNNDARKTIVNELSQLLSFNIPEHPELKMHVFKIVDKCINYNGGIEHFIDILLYFEDESLTAQTVCNLLNTLQNITRQPVSWMQLAKLKSLLNKIDCPPKEELRKISGKCVPPHMSLPSKMNDMNSTLHWLAQIGKRSEKSPILEFVSRLKQYIILDDALSKLDLWIDEVADEFKLSEEEKKNIGKEDTVEKYEKSDRYYLSFKLTPKYQGEYEVSAWLFNGNRMIKKLLPDENIKIGLTKLPETVDNYIDDANEFFESMDISDKQMIMEFFLPLELMNYGIEQMAVGDEFPIGIDYPVVIRSLERLENKKWHRRCAEFWKPSKIECEIDENCSMWLEDTDQNICSKLDKGTILFSLSFQPMENYLKSLIETGVPIAIWPRTANSDSINQYLKSVLPKHNVQQLTGLIHKTRRDILWDTNNRKHLGCISLLWDNPYRLPIKKKVCHSV